MIHRCTGALGELAADAAALTGMLLLVCMALGTLPDARFAAAGAAAGAVPAALDHALQRCARRWRQRPLRCDAAVVAAHAAARIAVARCLAPSWAAVAAMAFGFALVHPLTSGPHRDAVLSRRWPRGFAVHVHDAELLLVVLVRASWWAAFAGAALDVAALVARRHAAARATPRGAVAELAGRVADYRLRAPASAAAMVPAAT